MNEQLEKNKYLVVRNVLSEDLISIMNSYFTIKFLIQKDFRIQLGSVVEDTLDVVRPFSIKCYADAMTESLLLNLLPTIREITCLEKLEPSYSFSRFYEKGQWLEKHSDRPSCQYSITLPVMAFDDTPWIIHVEENAIDLNIGDMLVYKGCEAQHWREPFEGTYQTQAHLHYVNPVDPAYEPYVNDGRLSIGMKKH